MNKGIWLLLPVLLPIAAGLCAGRMRISRSRNAFVAAVLAAEVLVVLGAVCAAADGGTLVQITARLSIRLYADKFGAFFAVLVSVSWLLVGLFSFPYMEHEGGEARFYTFYLVTLGVLCGIAFAGNLMTLYVFYELMTLVTVPLVLHHGSEQARQAGIKYLGYSVCGAGLALAGFFFLDSLSESTAFVAGGFLEPGRVSGQEGTLLLIVFMMVIGFGAKAGMLPLQAWLPSAHPVAPAPASAVLSGVITKAGVVAIARVLYFVVGPQYLSGSWAQKALLVLALATVFAGSMLAYREKQLKRRLAYSTVSQVSYILFGLFLMNEAGIWGALLQMVFHMAAKNALFLCAGAIILQTGRTRVDELRGIGKRMPVVMWCFTIASLSLIGIPPFGGFISKWYLAAGALGPNMDAWGIAGVIVLLLSALLTAGYLLPIVTEAFFPGQEFDYGRLKKCEPGRLVTVPLFGFCLVVTVLGIFPTVLSNFLGAVAGAIL